MRFRFLSAGAIQGISRRLLLAVVFCAAVVEANGRNARATPSPHSPPVMVTRLYTGADGQSHIDQIPVIFRDASAAVVCLFCDPPEASAAVKMSDAYLVQGAPGAFQTLHNADKKRSVVVLSGAAEVATKGGESTGIVPGRLCRAEDLTGKGHTFRVLGVRSG
jgi:hypothetical protein